MAYNDEEYFWQTKNTKITFQVWTGCLGTSHEWIIHETIERNPTLINEVLSIYTEVLYIEELVRLDMAKHCHKYVNSMIHMRIANLMTLITSILTPQQAILILFATKATFVEYNIIG